MPSASGYRVTPELDISPAGIVKDSKVEWESDEPMDTSLTIESSLSTDQGSTWGDWQECINGEPVPQLSENDDLTDHRLKFRQNLLTDDPSITPILNSFDVYVNSKRFIGSSPILDITTIIPKCELHLDSLVILESQGDLSKIGINVDKNIFLDSLAIPLGLVLQTSKDISLESSIVSIEYLLQNEVDVQLISQGIPHVQMFSFREALSVMASEGKYLILLPRPFINTDFTVVQPLREFLIHQPVREFIIYQPDKQFRVIHLDKDYEVVQ